MKFRLTETSIILKFLHKENGFLPKETTDLRILIVEIPQAVNVFPTKVSTESWIAT